MMLSINFLRESRRRWVTLVHAAIARIAGVSLASVLVLDPWASADEFVPPPLFEEWFMIQPIEVCSAIGIEKKATTRTRIVHYPDPLLVGIPVTMTSYSSTVSQCDADPFITAMGTCPRPGVIALSRDLLREFTPGAPFRFGDRVFLDGLGEFIIEDTMHPRWTRRVDVWAENEVDAWHFGRRRGRLHAVPNPQIEVVRVAEAMVADGGELPDSRLP
jgi:3D (Asp-Asp-Asp) domain-containing protein